MSYVDHISIDDVQYDIRDAEAVSFEQEQTLTDAQKEQARANIGAGSEADVDDLKSAFTHLATGELLSVTVPTSGTNYDCYISQGAKIHIHAENASSGAKIFLRNSSSTAIKQFDIGGTIFDEDYIATADIYSARFTDNSVATATAKILYFYDEPAYGELEKQISTISSGKIIKVTNPQGVNSNYSVNIPTGLPVIVKFSGQNTSDYVNVFLRNASNQSVKKIFNANKSSGEYEWIATQDIKSIRITDNTHGTVTVEIDDQRTSYGNYEKIITINEKLIQTANKYLCDYTNGIASFAVESFLRGTKAAKSMVDIAAVKPEAVTHDASFVIVGGYAYVVFMTNILGQADNASSQTAKVRLSKVSLSDGTVTTIIVAQYQDTWGTHTITGGAGQPNIIYDGSKLIIWFTAGIDNTYQFGYAEYNLSTDTVENKDVVQIRKDSGSSYGIVSIANLNSMFGTMASTSIYRYQQANASTGAYNGTYYIGLVYGYGEGKAAIFSTTNGKNWTLFATVDHFDIQPLCELAVACDASGNVYAAMRPRNLQAKNAFFGVFAKYNSSGVLQSVTRYKNCGCRPAFVTLPDGSLMLYTNPMNRDRHEMVKIDTSDIQNSELFFDFTSNLMSYLNFACNNSKLYVVFTGTGGIELKEIGYPFATSSDIDTAVYGLFN